MNPSEQNYLEQWHDLGNKFCYAPPHTHLCATLVIITDSNTTSSLCNVGQQVYAPLRIVSHSNKKMENLILMAVLATEKHTSLWYLWAYTAQTHDNPLCIYQLLRIKLQLFQF
jgi:hypothetical protein